MVSRRHLLSSLGCAALAGCTAVLPDDSTQLGSVVAVNSTDDERTIEIRIAADDETVSTTTHRLDAISEQVPSDEQLPCEWGDDPDEFVIEARREDSEWRTLDVSERATSDCAAVGVHARDRGYLPPIEFTVHECSELADDYGCGFLE
ncbi:hypothetical protein C483_10426 [Natrialba hulunbeirensis JCM 10989]|uniref:Lipoprotein n=1 Tax=Natrialba hulunbeirensis JCM 10989 TaxID=1227493 RepID=M0A156_9EURY|nr:hypothetical protein [Natrialba hulunbeirensis]ELY91093.1 hypothetical protein C483_10426 [Natrialba hulunbeirensis JCM 10989]